MIHTKIVNAVYIRLLRFIISFGSVVLTVDALIYSSFSDLKVPQMVLNYSSLLEQFILFQVGL